MNDKEIRADAKLKNLPPEILEELWRYRNPEEDGRKLTYVEVLAELQSAHGISSSLGALSEFYSWLRLERRMQAARNRAEQARTLLAQDPAATPEAIARVGQMTFTAEMVQDGNVKAFVSLEKLRILERQINQDERRLALLETKARRMDELEAKAKEIKQAGGLSAETLEMLEKQLKLL
jgi:hypothetical protein